MTIDIRKLDNELELLKRELGEKEVTTNSLKLAKAAFLAIAETDLSHNNTLMIETFERIIKGLPLTEVTNNPDDWEEVPTNDQLIHLFHHKRYSALIREDTLIKAGPAVNTRYIDTNRVRTIDTNEYIEHPYMGGIGQQIYEEEYPIVFPYYPPTDKDTVFVGNYDRNEAGIFETIAVFGIRTKLGLRTINRYFAYIGGSYVEITANEFKERVGGK